MTDIDMFDSPEHFALTDFAWTIVLNALIIYSSLRGVINVAVLRVGCANVYRVMAAAAMKG